MSNPFLRRATEYIRDDSAFLAIVSPEPLTAFLARHKKKDALFDMPVRLIGTPGSGKTMMATLVEYRLLETILRDQSNPNNRALAEALVQTGFTDGDTPRVVAVRLPMESEYRDYWELPFDPAVKTKLVMSLIQARAVIGWLRNLTANNRRGLDEIRVIARDAAGAQLEQIGGVTAADILKRAREVDRAVYSVGASLLPPKPEDIPSSAQAPYQPFETIREIEIEWNGRPVKLQPLVILDDVHTLHPEQLDLLFRALTRREMRIGRWLMMRLDALSPASVFQSDQQDAFPGLKSDRDYLDISMQSQRGSDRKQFRRLAADMSDRYLRLVPALANRRHTHFAKLLSGEPPTLTDGRLEELRQQVAKDQRRLKVTPERRTAIEELVSSYVKGSHSIDVNEDVQLAMVRVLMHRYDVRIAAQTPSLFEAEDPEPKTPLKADIDVADAARIYLTHRFDRPLHYGIDDIANASNENAEQFLHMAGALVDRMETRAIRNLDPALSPSQQQAALIDKTEEMIAGWSFPFARKVREFVRHVARECLEESLLGNAPLGAGANAIAVPDSQMDELLASEHELAQVLKYAQAYGAIVAVRKYGQGGKEWCLLELAGPVCLNQRLTLKRGGFLERKVEDLIAVVEAV
ncbi:hypothetical protein AS593_06040 [Caulobacter vibrioides]|nr:hypothetical protein AS593_06040 [Caulobacter vibrioides]